MLSRWTEAREVIQHRDERGRDIVPFFITFYNDNVYNISPYTPVPTKALLQEVNVKMIDLKMHECWKVKKPTGKQQAGGDLSARA